MALLLLLLLQYNTCYWCLVKAGKSPAEAQATIKVRKETMFVFCACPWQHACLYQRLSRSVWDQHQQQWLTEQAAKPGL